MKRLWDGFIDRAVLAAFFLWIAAVTVFSPKKALETIQGFLTDP